MSSYAKAVVHYDLIDRIVHSMNVFVIGKRIKLVRNM